MKPNVSSHWLIGLILALSVLLIGGNLALRSSKGARQDQVAQIINETQSLQVEDLKITDPRPGEKNYSFSLRNTSNKEIVAWVIETPSVTQIAGASLGQGLAPGETRSAGAYDTSPNRIEGKKIVIKLAMFADGSSEGDFQYHKEVAESREGARVQTERINTILEAAIIKRKGRPNEGSEKEWLATVAAAISELPETALEGRPKTAMGMTSPKQDALRYIAALGEWEDSRHKDAVKADKIMRETGEVVFGSKDVTDGLEHIAHHNEWLIGKKKEKTGGANAK
jgi:hypothetical protein